MSSNQVLSENLSLDVARILRSIFSGISDDQLRHDVSLLVEKHSNAIGMFGYSSDVVTDYYNLRAVPDNFCFDFEYAAERFMDIILKSFNLIQNVFTIGHNKEQIMILHDGFRVISKNTAGIIVNGL
jgi:hypothetical protein